MDGTRLGYDWLERNYMKHLGTQTIETERLILRKFVIEDAQAMFDNWAKDEEVTRYLTWPPHQNVEITKMILNSWIEQYDKADYYQWAIILKSNGQDPIGCIGTVKQEDDIEMVHIGYCMGKAWWHQGVMSEALAAIMTYFFKQVKVNRMESCHDILNPHSGDVMKKCGMQLEGIRKQAGLTTYGSYADMVMYAILANDYFNKGKK